MRMENEAALKHQLDEDAVATVAQVLTALHPPFPAQDFRSQATKDLRSMEMKDRVRHIIRALDTTLPRPFPLAADILERIPERWPDNGSFAAWPLVDYVGECGLDYPAEALRVLRAITPLFSAEFAIRPFLMHHTEPTLEELRRWTHDPSEHVRRLVSEGTRPRLPWGPRLTAFVDNPAPILPLLEALRDDESEYVRRSVANNLNDIAKDHPELVIDIGRRWLEGADANRRKLVTHACRTLVKRGHPLVFPLLGYEANPELKIAELDWPREGLRIGETAQFGLLLENRTDRTQRVVVDFAIHYRKARGALSAKVFKWGNIELEPGASRRLRKKLSFADVSIRKHYAGEHRFALQINGQVAAERSFELFE